MPSVRLALDFSRLLTDPDHLPAILCPDCQDLLTIHQPDIESPDRLLGVCPECRAWFLVEDTHGIMVRLPDQDALREGYRLSSSGASYSDRLGR
jgi:uncharacterized protein YbaR (Trm112 family)